MTFLISASFYVVHNNLPLYMHASCKVTASHFASPRPAAPSPLRAREKKIPPIPIFSDVCYEKKTMIFPLLKITKRLSALFLKVAARGRLCCSSLVCTLKKAVITEIVRRTLKKLEKQILRMTKYYYYYADRKSVV